MDSVELEYKEIICDQIQKSGHNFHTRFRYSLKYIAEYLKSKYPQLIGHPITEHIYWFLNDLTDFPKCQNSLCSNDVKFYGYFDGYQKYCCPKCSNSSYTKIELTRNNVLDKYGVDNVSKLESTKQKTIQTCVDRYGVTSTNQLESVKEKKRNTCIEHFGYIHPLKNPLKMQELMKSNLNNLGVENAFQLEKVKNLSHTFEIMYPIHCRTFDKLVGCEFDSPCFDRDSYAKLKFENPNALFEFECRKCGNHFWSLTKNGGWHRKCKCQRSNLVSKQEKSILRIVTEMYSGQIVENDRTQMTPNDRNGWKYNHELDIWIPDLRIAIEYNGTYWHDGKKFPQMKMSDEEKVIQCKEKGIELIQISESEWEENPKIVQLNLKKIIDKRVKNA